MKKVTDQRWQEAQKWEKNFWDKIVRNSFSLNKGQLFKTLVKMGIRYGLGNDSNHWWTEKFDNYKFVSEELNNVVEFGCGPFTNLRIILKNKNVNHVFASDPLAIHYLKYKHFQLYNNWKNKKYLIDDHPLEEAPFASNYFDLAICINVLDHVCDPDLCLKQFVRVIANGGIAIFGQDLTNQDDFLVKAKEANKVKDIGHPHIFDNPEALLSYFNMFQPIIKKVLRREEGRLPKWHFGTLIFAGKKIA